MYVQAYLLAECTCTNAATANTKVFAEGGPYGCNNAHQLITTSSAAGQYITVFLNVTTGSRVEICQPVSNIFKLFAVEGRLMCGLCIVAYEQA